MQKVKTICEIGINHNADLDIAKKLIDVAASAGVDYVKFQKRTPELCVPEHQKNVMRETPWGEMTYLQYRNKIEFGKKEYDEIDFYCKKRGIRWSASAWDIPSLEFLMLYDLPWIKIPSACLTDDMLMRQASMLTTPLILSTGMSEMPSILKAVVDTPNLSCIMHCVSTYPSKPKEQNLRCITTLREEFPWVEVGFSNHAPGLVYIAPAIALGATWIEFHVTLDRSSWGTDQSASIEPEGVFKAMKYIRTMEQALGDGIKKIQDSEIPIMQKLRRVNA